MLEIGYKGKVFNNVHVWFSNPSYLSERKCDFCLYHGIPKLHDKGNAYTIQKSLLTDLTKTEDTLFASFEKSVRYEINRSKRDGNSTRIYMPNEIHNNKDLLNSFADCYAQMYRSKGMKGELSLSELQAYAFYNSLYISVVSLGDETLVYHSYVADYENIRLLHSCSTFRNADDSSVRTQIGRANRHLHWDDILYFRKMGIKIYDWGGIHSVEEPNGIDKFKMSFGGTPTEYYNEKIPYSLKAKLYAWIIK